MTEQDRKFHTGEVMVLLEALDLYGSKLTLLKLEHPTEKLPCQRLSTIRALKRKISMFANEEIVEQHLPQHPL